LRFLSKIFEHSVDYLFSPHTRNFLLTYSQSKRKRKTLSISETKITSDDEIFFYIDIYSSLPLMEIFSNKKTARQNREQIYIVNGNDDGQIEETKKKRKKRNQF
jgi:hypothetical protein